MKHDPETRISGNVFQKKYITGKFLRYRQARANFFFSFKQRCSHYKFSDPPIKEEPSSTFIMMNHFLTSEHSLARSQTRCIFQGLGTWTPQQHHILVEKKDIPGNTPLKINVVRKGRAGLHKLWYVLIS